MFKSTIPRIAVMIGATALAAPLATAALAADKYPPSVIAMNQKPKGDNVSITFANLPAKGTLAIYKSDSEGRIGKARVGQVALDAGAHRDFKVKLSPMPRDGARLWAVLEHPNGTPFKHERSNYDRSFKVL
jgi:hypothetical protein